ncbi:hypothetical protein TNCT_495211 [Trichonephila clavata]|uniref:Uncharacterized protein n=1 Tax=Trichonephila clavata TaxID=2740835 RepID=A0A8X6GIU9_TRICU|nr:hypothetical protein TNCT_495211 [Trichonephila clavata]
MEWRVCVTRMLLVSCRGEHQKSFQRQQEISTSNLPTLVRGGMFPCFPNPPLSFPLGVFPFERCPWKRRGPQNVPVGWDSLDRPLIRGEASFP